MSREAPKGNLDRWAFALEASETGAWELNLSDGTAWRSPLHDRIFGYDDLLPEWTYEMFLQHVLEADRAEVDEAFQGAIRERGDWHFECRILRADGRQRWIAARGRVHCDDQGLPAIIWGTVQDITERKRSEDALRESEERYRTLFHSMEEGFCIIERVTAASGGLSDFRYVTVNPAFAIQTGLEDVVGKTIREIEPWEPQGWIDIYDEIVRTGEPLKFERELASRRRVLDLHAFRIGGESSRRVGVIFWDVSERKRTERALREASRQKDEFLATLSHELRNPLAPIQSGIDILRLYPPDAEARERVLDLMSRQMASLRRLVDELFDVSRIITGRYVLQTEPLDLRVPIREAAQVLESAARTVSLDLPSEPLVVNGDGVRLRQVIDNLIDNAAKFTDEAGNIWIKAEQRHGTARLSVRDDGLGIEPDMLDKVFETFYQSHTDSGGLGIGLSLARRLIDLHGGSIAARSEGAGKGAELVVELPLLEGPAPTTRARVPSKAVQPAAGIRVLVVDDNQDAAELMGTLLREMGAVVRTAHDGLSALAVIEHLKPELALLDLGMERMDGYQLATTIRSRPAAKDALLVAVTGWGQAADKARACVAGFDEHLTKPVDRETLERLLATTPRRA